MAFVKNIFNAVKGATAPPRDPVVAGWFGGIETESGEDISADTVTRVSAVLACVRVLSETIAGLPLFVYRRIKGGGRVRDFNHPLNLLLTTRPNRWQTPFELKEMMMWHILLRGNAYAEVVLSRSGNMELIPRHPDRVVPFFTDNNEVAYKYLPEKGGDRIILSNAMHHWRSFSADGLKGESVITHARETLGISLAADKFGARYFKNDATPGGVIKHPGHFKDKEQFERLKKTWQDSQGGKNRHKPALLEDGMDYMPIGVTNKDSQFLELRQFQIADIARMFLVQPHKIMDLTKATFSNIEQQGIDFVTSSIQPWVTRIEQACERDLMTEQDLKTNFIRFNMNALLRGDSAARSEFYAKLFNIGALSQNDIRRREDENPIKGGDRYFVPLNMVPVDQVEKKADDLLNSAINRMVRQEASAVSKSKNKLNAKDFRAWLSEFYQKHSEKVSESLIVDINLIKEYFANQVDLVCDSGVDEQSRYEQLRSMSTVELEVEIE